MRLDLILELFGDVRLLFENRDIKWLLTDSRTLTFPQESLFFAIVTDRNDGHKYIPELYARGVRCFVVQYINSTFENLEDIVLIQVVNSVDALQKLASYNRSLHAHVPTIAVTGSNGKTIVKEWLYQLLNGKFNIVRSPKSYNSQIGVPLSAWMLDEHCTLAIFEAGISKPYEMGRLESILKPKIGVFTNLGDAHQENFISLKQKCEEKLQLFKNSEILVYCADNKLVDITISQVFENRIKLFKWGSVVDCNLRVCSVRKHDSGAALLLDYKGERIEILIPFLDDASIENALHCISVLLLFDYGWDEIQKLVDLLEPVAMRLEVKEGVRNTVLINDTYNSDINSLKIAIDYLAQKSLVARLPMTVVFSDVKQSGNNKVELYRLVSQLIIQKGVSRFIGIGTEITSFKNFFTQCKSSFYSSTDDFIHSSEIQLIANEMVLVKGARDFYFEKIVEVLEKQVHETVLEVNLNAFIDNFNNFRSKLKPTTKIMCMVKADGYGGGAIEIARTLQQSGCDYLAVAVADEGAELRLEGIQIPIVVMNPEQAGFGVIIEHRLEPEIYNLRLFDLFISEVKKRGLVNYPIHIKIDSGMHRLGFEDKDVDLLICRLKSNNYVKVESVFSHLSGADDKVYDQFTQLQAKRFQECADKIQKHLNYEVQRHILNSAGTERFPTYQFDMVRVGIGHYGVSALSTHGLKNVCSLKTIILQIKEVKAGESVGYSRGGICSYDRRIAVIPIGYADGYDRRLGNGLGQVYIKGRRAQTVGNICMDLTMIDVTGIQVEEGDAVEVFGDNVTISEVASWLDTIPYEVITSVSRRVKRVYFQE